MGLPKDFVIHSLRHTMLTGLGESGVDAFTIMRIAGHIAFFIRERYRSVVKVFLQDRERK